MILEATFVDDIGGFLAALGDDVIGAEVVGGGFEVGEGELRERRELTSGIIGAVGGRRKIVDVVFVIIEMRAASGNRIFGKRRCTTAHYSDNRLGAPNNANY